MEPATSRKIVTPAASGPMPAGSALDEYRHLGDDLRHYATLRLYRLTLLLGTTGAIITALASDAVRSQPIAFQAVKVGALVVTLAFAIMDYRSGRQWLRLQARANVLAERLGFEPRPTGHGWNPLTTTGVSRALHLFLIGVWLFVLVRSLLPR